MNDLLQTKTLLSELTLQSVVLATAMLALSPPVGLAYEARREALEKTIARARHELALPGDRGE
jgi:hypothetical protein